MPTNEEASHTWCPFSRVARRPPPRWLRWLRRYLVFNRVPIDAYDGTNARILKGAECLGSACGVWVEHPLQGHEATDAEPIGHCGLITPQGD